MSKDGKLEDLEKDINSFMRKNSLLFGVENKIEKTPLPKEQGLKSFAGGSARKISSKQSDNTTLDLAKKFEEEYGIFSKPASNPKNKEVIEVVDDLMDMYFTNDFGKKKRIQNGAQAVVRNPILRGDYGNNTGKTAYIKGFNRLMIDTGQFFNCIIADVGE